MNIEHPFLQRGTLAIVGIGSQLTPQLILQVAIVKSVTVKGVLLGSTNDLQEVLKLLQQKKGKFHPLST